MTDEVVQEITPAEVESPVVMQGQAPERILTITEQMFRSCLETIWKHVYDGTKWTEAELKVILADLVKHI